MPINMRRYFENLHARPAHEKRQFSMQVAGMLTALIFVVWISTLGVRLADGIAKNNDSNDSADTAGLIAATAAAGSDLQQQFPQLQQTAPSSQLQTDYYSNASGAYATTTAPEATSFSRAASRRKCATPISTTPCRSLRRAPSLTCATD
jgi:hypothetical protein